MAILAECSQCKRKGGYAEKDGDKICARCKSKKVSVRLEDKDNKLSAEEKKQY